MPTLAVFQLYCGENKFYINLRHLQVKHTCLIDYKTSGLYVQIKETLKG